MNRQGRGQGKQIIILGEGAVEKNAVDLFIRPQLERDLTDADLPKVKLVPIDLKGKLKAIKDYVEKYYETRALQGINALSRGNICQTAHN